MITVTRCYANTDIKSLVLSISSCIKVLPEVFLNHIDTNNHIKNSRYKDTNTVHSFEYWGVLLVSVSSIGSTLQPCHITRWKDHYRTVWSLKKESMLAFKMIFLSVLIELYFFSRRLQHKSLNGYLFVIIL